MKWNKDTQLTPRKWGKLGPVFNFPDQVTGKIIDEDSELEHLCSLNSVILTIINYKTVVAR